jgi:SOS response associated peptidase (SRAP)
VPAEFTEGSDWTHLLVQTSKLDGKALRDQTRPSPGHRPESVVADDDSSWAIARSKSRSGGEPFAFAGIWEGDRFALLTTELSADVRPVHDRMPVILDCAELAGWIDPCAKPDELQPLLRPRPDGWLEAVAVSRRVNNARNDTPDCLEPESDGSAGMFNRGRSALALSERPW